MTLPVGLRIDSYVIAEYLGEGGTSEVYLVRRGEESFALKILKEEERQSEVLQTRLINEAASLRQLNVEGVVRVHDEGDFAGRPYYVMEYLPSSLADRLQRPLWPSQIVPNIRTILRILSVLHESRFVHRDVKPSNILFAPDGSVRLADFGHAKLPMEQLAVVPHSTQTGAFLGTREYAAPEQFLNAKTVDGRADVYAAGLILFEALAGRRPFPTENPEELARLRLTVRAPRLSSPLLDLSPQLVTLVAKMLERSPQSRPTAKEVLARLTDLPLVHSSFASPSRYAALLFLPVFLSTPATSRSMSSPLPLPSLPPLEVAMTKPLPQPVQRGPKELLKEFDHALDCGTLAEASGLLQRVETLPLSPDLAAKLLQKQADLSRELGQRKQAMQRYSDACFQFHDRGMWKQEADCINRLGDMKLHHGDTTLARRLYQESEKLRVKRAQWKESPDTEEFYFSLYRFGLLAIEQADWKCAREKLQEAKELPVRPLWIARAEERLASLPPEKHGVSLAMSALQNSESALRTDPNSRQARSVYLKAKFRLWMLQPSAIDEPSLFEELRMMWSQDKQRGYFAHEYLGLLMEGVHRRPQQKDLKAQAREVLRELQRRGQWQDDVHIQRWKVRLGA